MAESLIEIQKNLNEEIALLRKKVEEFSHRKPQMKFHASMVGKDPIITGACPHAIAWLDSMGKKHIKPTDLFWVGKMGIEMAIVTGNIKQVQKEIGRDKIDKKGLLTGNFDATRYHQGS